MSNPMKKFLADAEKEYFRAKDKHPGGKKLDTALTEEVGELAQALLHIEEKDGCPSNVYKEAVQVVAVAMRIAIDGAPEHGYKGMLCGYMGCDSPATKSLCALCYE